MVNALLRAQRSNPGSAAMVSEPGLLRGARNDEVEKAMN
jgi:hypothetical protein